ncbi:MAG TPA: sigma 54-interacting transcriptional regulator [Phycisphaerae bacterium]|nr:sigma 54-interacting transcriptional regulator [Phycisphaerae bacterium]
MTQMLDRIALDQVLASTQDGLFVLNDQHRFVYFNAGCERLTGYSSREVLAAGQACWQIIECRDEYGRVLADRLCVAKSVLTGEQSTARQLVRITTKGGESRWVETLFTCLRTQPGKKGGYVIGVMRDVSEAKQREDSWQRTIEDLRREVETLRQQMRDRYGFVSIVTKSPVMRQVLDKTRAACTNASPLLICGERGTGKEMIARTIHYNGLQKDGPFVFVGTSAVPRDRLEIELFGGVYEGRDCAGLTLAADGGTLFVAGVDLLPEDIQSRLLRMIQEKEIRPVGGTHTVPVQVRLIASADRSVQDLYASNRLSDELLQRLSVVSIEIPPLRVRKEDIPLLVEQFIGTLNQQSTRQVRQIGSEVWGRLESHDWPGNAQELQNVIEAAFAAGQGDVLRAAEVAIPPSAGRDGRLSGGSEAVSLDDLLADSERWAILSALRQAGGGRSLAARTLGISRSRLYRRMDALGIDPNSTAQ